MAYTSDLHNSQSTTQHQIRLQAKGIGSTQILPDLPNGNFEQETADQWKLGIKDFFHFNSCITLNDIESITIIQGSNDGWNIGSIATFAVTDSECWELISSDYSINQWVDGDGFEQHKEFVLSLKTTAGPCINYLYIWVYTSSLGHNHTEDDHDVSHEIELKADGIVKKMAIDNFPNATRGDQWKFSLEDDFGFDGCLRKKDIQSITLLADDSDEWNIDTIVTYVAPNEYGWILSSVDFDVNRWVDSDDDASMKQFELNLVI